MTKAEAKKQQKRRLAAKRKAAQAAEIARNLAADPLYYHKKKGWLRLRFVREIRAEEAATKLRKRQEEDAK